MNFSEIVAIELFRETGEWCETAKLMWPKGAPDWLRRQAEKEREAHLALAVRPEGVRKRIVAVEERVPADLTDILALMEPEACLALGQATVLEVSKVRVWLAFRNPPPYVAGWVKEGDLRKAVWAHFGLLEGPAVAVVLSFGDGAGPTIAEMEASAREEAFRVEEAKMLAEPMVTEALRIFRGSSLVRVERVTDE
jgi:hypothetical protein